jgi:hypothetical protein
MYPGPLAQARAGKAAVGYLVGIGTRFGDVIHSDQAKALMPQRRGHLEQLRFHGWLIIAPAIQAIIDTRIRALEKRTEAQFNRCAGLGVTRQGIHQLKHRISPVYPPIIRQIRHFEP